MLSLGNVVSDFAAGLAAADAKRPVFTSRTGRIYQAGIGPHGEDRAVELTIAEMRTAHPERYTAIGQGLQYPNSKQRCDVWIGEPVTWVLEIKMARFFGDNGKPDDTSLKDLLSPFDLHRSALTDAQKLAASTLPGRRAVLIYGFTYPRMPLELAIEAFEVLARARVSLGPRASAPLGALVHPVHAQGAVFGWEVLGYHAKQK
ncbi:MAG TPA: hypothetical protein VMK42_20640 [Anaeromyxobacteraceae bacterium]|nr:hypothetical protein [Anaeromyxobacteraceae bacterium]